MPLGIHRHIITVGGNWDPSDSVTTSFHIDAADTSSYSLSGSNVSSITDKAGNFSITVNGTPIQTVEEQQHAAELEASRRGLNAP